MKHADDTDWKDLQDFQSCVDWKKMDRATRKMNVLKVFNHA
jgi:hypothetical protein